MDPDQTAPVGLHCLNKRLPKHSGRQQKQIFVVIGALRFNTSHIFKCFRYLIMFSRRMPSGIHFCHLSGVQCHLVAV